VASRGTYNVPTVQHPAYLWPRVPWPRRCVAGTTYADAPVRPCLARAAGPWCGAHRRGRGRGLGEDSSEVARWPVPSDVISIRRGESGLGRPMRLVGWRVGFMRVHN
jgi:hypothetical protein